MRVTIDFDGFESRVVALQDGGSDYRNLSANAAGPFYVSGQGGDVEVVVGLAADDGDGSSFTRGRISVGIVGVVAALVGGREGVSRRGGEFDAVLAGGEAGEAVGAVADGGGGGNDGFAGNFLVVRYETLLEKTASEIQRLFEFLDLRVNERIIDRAVEKTSFETLAKGRSRGQEDVANFYRKGITGDWKQHFTAGTNAFVTKRAGNLMSEFDYWR